MRLVNCLLTAKKLFSQSCLRNLMSESDYVTQWKFLKRRTAYLCGHLKCLFKVNESHLRQTRKHRKSQVYNEIIIMYAFAQRSIFSMFYERRRSVFLYNSWASYLFDSVRSTKLAIRRFAKRSYRIVSESKLNDRRLTSRAPWTWAKWVASCSVSITNTQSMSTGHSGQSPVVVSATVWIQQLNNCCYATSDADWWLSIHHYIQASVGGYWQQRLIQHL